VPKDDAITEPENEFSDAARDASGAFDVGAARARDRADEADDEAFRRRVEKEERDRFNREEERQIAAVGPRTAFPRRSDADSDPEMDVAVERIMARLRGEPLDPDQIADERAAFDAFLEEDRRRHPYERTFVPLWRPERDPVPEPEDRFVITPAKLEDAFIDDIVSATVATWLAELEGTAADPVTSDDPSTFVLDRAARRDVFDHALADLYEDQRGPENWGAFVARIDAALGRTDEGDDEPDQADPLFGAFASRLGVQLQDDMLDSAEMWDAFAAQTDVGFRLVVRDDAASTPAGSDDFLMPSDPAATWGYFAARTELDLRLAIRDQVENMDVDTDGSGAERGAFVEPPVREALRNALAARLVVQLRREPKLPRESVLDYIDPEPERPPASPLEAIERELSAPPSEASGEDDAPNDPVPAAPPPPTRSVLDYIDPEPERPPSSPLEAIERELAAPAAAGDGRDARSQRRVPIWAWPAALAAVIAIAAFLLLGGGDDEPEGAVAGGGGGGTPATTATPPLDATTAGGSAAPTVLPTAGATMTTGQIPSVIVCPDGSTFSGFEQQDGSFLDAETGEPRVCPPPPN